MLPYDLQAMQVLVIMVEIDSIQLKEELLSQKIKFSHNEGKFSLKRRGSRH